MTTYETVRDLARAMPGVEESTSYGTPALKVKKKLMVRLKEDGTTIVLYRGYPTVLAKLPRMKKRQLRDVMAMAYRFVTAPKRKSL